MKNIRRSRQPELGSLQTILACFCEVLFGKLFEKRTVFPPA